MTGLTKRDPKKRLLHCDPQFKNDLTHSHQCCHKKKIPTYFLGLKLNQYLSDELILEPDTKYRFFIFLATKIKGLKATRKITPLKQVREELLPSNHDYSSRELRYHLRNTVRNVTTGEVVKKTNRVKVTFTNEDIENKDMIISTRTRQISNIKMWDDILNDAVCNKKHSSIWL